MSATTHDDYYVSKRDKLIKALDRLLSRVRPQMVARYGESDAAVLHQQILAEFERLLPQIPYIGGDKNPLTPQLIQSAWALAVYRVLQQRGGSVEEAGELLLQGAEAMFNAIPKFLRHLFGKMRFSKLNYPRLAASSRETQKREYPGNWVREFIVGDGESFDVGIDYTECGIVKFMDAQGASELTPYLCQTDYALFEAIGLHLERTETIASGCQRCNFRISKKGKCQEPAARVLY